MIDGQAVPYCLARIPPEGETRGNLAAGGSGVPAVVEFARLLVSEPSERGAKKRGLLFVGLDVIWKLYYRN